MSYKETLEAAVSAKNFRLEPCLTIEEVISPEITNGLHVLMKRLSAKLYNSFKSAIIRSSFLIELTNPTAETDSTKYQVRWVDVLKKQNDVRFATYEQCVDICEKIIQKIRNGETRAGEYLFSGCAGSVSTYLSVAEWEEHKRTTRSLLSTMVSKYRCERRLRFSWSRIRNGNMRRETGPWASAIKGSLKWCCPVFGAR